MTILLVLLIAVFFLLVIRLFTVREGFQSTTFDLDPSFVSQYEQFTKFYNQFMTNWQNTITTSIASETQQEPLASPSGSSTSSQPPQPSVAQMNEYITMLQQQLGQPLPQVTNSLPTEINSSQIPMLLQTLPHDPTPFNNALTWMNTQLQKSHASLGTALQGLPVEPFQDTCQNIAQCIANNPQLAQELAQQISQQQKQQHRQIENQIIQILQSFNANQELQTALQTNQGLIQKSQEIQNQAQSGELYNQINIAGAKTQTQYTLPLGANALSDLQKSDPQKYNDYKQNYSQWFNIKSLIEQINSTL